MRIRDIGESFWEPRKGPLVFYLFGLLSSISATLWSEQVPGGSGLAWMIQWGVPAVVAAVILAGWVPRLFPIYRQELAPVSGGPAAATKGLVVLASPREGIETARHAVKYATAAGNRLRALWIVHSESSLEAAAGLKTEMLRENVLPDDRIRLLRISDQDLKRPELVCELIEAEVYGRLPEGVTPGDVTIDLTGATKTATAGAFLAGLPEGRLMQVIPAATVDERQRGIKPGDPIQIRIDYKLKKIEVR